jgi:hypothetical protein
MPFRFLFSEKYAMFNSLQSPKHLTKSLVHYFFSPVIIVFEDLCFEFFILFSTLQKHEQTHQFKVVTIISSWNVSGKGSNTFLVQSTQFLKCRQTKFMQVIKSKAGVKQTSSDLVFLFFRLFSMIKNF